VGLGVPDGDGDVDAPSPAVPPPVKLAGGEGTPVSHPLGGGGGAIAISDRKSRSGVCTVGAFENASGGGRAACGPGASEAAAPSSSSATPSSLLFPSQGRGRGYKTQHGGSCILPGRPGASLPVRDEGGNTVRSLLYCKD